MYYDLMSKRRLLLHCASVNGVQDLASGPRALVTSLSCVSLTVFVQMFKFSSTGCHACHWSRLAARCHRVLSAHVQSCSRSPSAIRVFCVGVKCDFFLVAVFRRGPERTVECATVKCLFVSSLFRRDCVATSRVPASCVKLSLIHI